MKRSFLFWAAAIYACLPLMAGPVFYLRGLDGKWDALDQYKFEESGGIYTLYLDELTSGSDFKIATADWSLQFGSETTELRFDTPMICVAGDGHNIPTANVAGVTLVFDYTNISAPELTAVPDLYLAGDFNSWSNTDSSKKFKREGNLYTLSVSELSGKFRIAAGITPNWTVEFGGQSDMELDKDYDCIAGSGNDMSLKDDYGAVDITFNKATKKIRVSGIKADDGKTEFYLAGAVNGWASDNSAYKFDYRNGVYVLELEKLSGEFKVVTADWGKQYGCRSTISYDKVYAAELAASGLNMKLAEAVGNDVIIMFDYQNQTIEVTGMPGLYLIGDFNNWGISPLYAFSYADGVYTLTTHDFSGEFKVSNSDYSLQLGTDLSSSFGLDNNYPLVETGQTDGNISFGGAGSRASTQRIKLTLMANGTPGVTTSINDVTDSDAPAEYFNLQGIKVAHPASGIYIRRQGLKVDKIAIK